MTKRMTAALLSAAAASLALTGPAPAATHARHHAKRAKHATHARRATITPLAVQAPEDRAGAKAPPATGPACVTPPPLHTYAFYHCYRPQDIASAYGVDTLHASGTMGAGQTIVLVDSYGSPTAAQDLKTFHDTFYKDLPAPNFDQVHPQGAPDYKNTGKGNGQSGPSAAEGWAGEAELDVEWSYAMAPLAHIVLLAVPPAETEGVQGFPNLFKAMSAAIDKYPKGTIFSQSFGVTEETFGGAAQTQTARFDAIYAKAAARGDTMLASSGDDGSFGVSKQHRDTGSYDHPTVGWPASSPWVTAVGGTQLQKGWTWDPQSDVPFTAEGDFNPAYFQWTDGGDSEPVWNESWLPAATGGGKSLIYGRPAWQNSVAGVVGSSRGVPDVAWNAAVNGGVLTYQSFFPNNERVGWHVYGGTSAASPQLAGLLALANEQQTKAGGEPVGYINPLLYSIGSGPAFRDVVPVTEGTAESGKLVDNREWDYNGDGLAVTRDPVPGWPVQTGYDLTTGFGTPNAPAFVAALRAARDSAG